MTTYSNSTEKKGFYQQCFHDNTLGVLKPTTSGITEFRPIPEYVDGLALPMVKSMTPGGPDLSNIILEEVLINAGNTSKFNGICRPSDATPEMNAISYIFSGLYIRIKSRVKKGQVPTELQAKISDLLLSRPNPKGDGHFSYLPRASENGFIQGIGLSLNSKAFDKPRSRQALCLTKPAVGKLFELAAQCAKEGKDIFSPKDGYTIIVKGLPKDPSQGRNVPMYQVELGRQIPIPADKAAQLWTPWEKAIKRYTVAECIAIAIKLYGRDVVEFVFPDEVAMYASNSRAASVASAAVQQPTPPKAPESKPAATGQELALDTGAPVLTDEPEPESEEAAPAAAAAAAAAAGGTGKVKTPEEMAKEYEKMLTDLA